MDFNSISLVVIALLTAFTAYTNYYTQKMVIETKNISLMTERNTNSMKDALVASTAKASKAEGRAEMKAELKD